MRALRAFNRTTSSRSTFVVRPPRTKPRSMVAMAASRRHSEEDAARLERAKSYPYARPNSSFIYINGHAFTFDCAAWTPRVASGGRWLTELRVRPPAALLDAARPTNQGDEELVSVVDACDRFFGFCARRALELPPADPSAAPAPADASHFTPILAVGSNAGVAQLGRKFPLDLFPRGVVVPVIRAVLRGFDVAFAPLITSYGSAPATLHPSPGTHVELFVTHLSPAQARRMHETEGAYNLQRLSNVALREGAGIEHFQRAAAAAGESPALEPTATRLLTYGHQAGTLQLRFRRRRDDDGEEEQQHLETPVALAEIRAHGRRFPALTQVQMLRAVRHALLRAAEEEEGEEEGEEQGATTAAAAATTTASSDTSGDDALPPPRPLPPILHPEHAQECWLGTEEPELDAFLLRCLDCADTRKRQVERLTAAATPFEAGLSPPAEVEVLQTMGTVLSDNVK